MSKNKEYITLNGMQVPQKDWEDFCNAMTDHKESHLNKAQERKNTPIYTGFIKYFPLVFGEVAKASVAGNKQHLEGQPLHWDRTKSKDQLDAGLRHIIDHARGELIDDDGVYHLAKAIWRLSAELELILENK